METSTSASSTAAWARVREAPALAGATALRASSASVAMSSSTRSTAPEWIGARALVDLHPGVEVVAAEQGVDEGQSVGRGSVEREGDEHGALALAQVVAGGLARRLRVAEDAEQVVAQLERPPRARP